MKMTPLRFLLALTLIPSVFNKKIGINCPPQCKCEFYEHFKSTTCVNQKLVTIESFIPKNTEVLDLSYNQISNLEDNTFIEQNLISLKLLNISHNKVSQIHMNAFKGLDHLKTLDLSFNAMRYLLDNWFWSLKSINELYLRGNSFDKFNEEPLFQTKSLKILDFSKCSISYIGPSAFTKMPNLEILDLSENYLIQIDSAVIQPLPNLRIFKVNNNTFTCNDLMKNLAKYCLEKGIGYQNPCAVKNKTDNDEKFQKMINMVQIVEKNSWIYDDDDEEQKLTTIINICNSTSREDKSLLMEIINLSPTLSVLIPLIYGIAIGILIGCSVQIRNKKPDDRRTSFNEAHHLRRQNSNPRSKNHNTDTRESLLLNEWPMFESTPVLSRKA